MQNYQGYIRKKKVSIVSAPKANKNSTLNDGKIEQDQKENDQEKDICNNNTSYWHCNCSLSCNRKKCRICAYLLAYYDNCQ